MALPQAKSERATTTACDLRPWLEAVEDLGQLERISGSHWDLEIGALSELILEKLSAPPALLFDRVPGYEPGRRGGKIFYDAKGR